MITMVWFYITFLLFISCIISNFAWCSIFQKSLYDIRNLKILCRVFKSCNSITRFKFLVNFSYSKILCSELRSFWKVCVVLNIYDFNLFSPVRITGSFIRPITDHLIDQKHIWSDKICIEQNFHKTLFHSIVVK